MYIVPNVTWPIARLVPGTGTLLKKICIISSTKATSAMILIPNYSSK
jgi:hypothetical protein